MAPKDAMDEFKNYSREKEIENQITEIRFKCAMGCFSIIRFIAEYIDELPTSVTYQLVENNDIPCTLIPMLELRPWLRKNAKNEVEKWEDQAWKVVPPKDSQLVTKIEAQVWLTIYNLFLCSSAGRKYEITSFRMDNLLRLRKFMNEVLIDQLPMLADMHRALEEMAIKGSSSLSSNNAFIVQALPELRTRIMKGKNWAKIAKE